MTSLRDSAVVSNIQLALLGIILVVGIFYNWRALSRIEEKVDGLSRNFAAAAAGAGLGGGGARGDDLELYDGPVSDADAEAAEAFMQNVFGSVAYNAASVAAAGGGVPGAAVVVEEVPKGAAAPVAPVAAPVAAAPAPAPLPVPDEEDVVAAALSAPDPEPAPREPAESSADGGADQAITKTSLRRMNAETLREVCMSHGLPSDGPRALLMDRLFDHLFG